MQITKIEDRAKTGAVVTWQEFLSILCIFLRFPKKSVKMLRS